MLLPRKPAQFPLTALPSQEILSQEGSNLISSQAGRLAGDIATSQEASMAPPNNRLGSSQAGRQLGTQPGAEPPQASQGNSATPQASSASSQEARVVPPSNSLGSSQAVRQVVRHPGRCGALQASQGNSTTPRASSASSWEGILPPNRLPQGSSLEEPNQKWVINLSSKPLTQAQRSVLAEGPNFVISPKHPPNLEYITTIETACTKLSQQDAEELRADINRVLMSSYPQTQFNQNSKLSFKGT